MKKAEVERRIREKYATHAQEMAAAARTAPPELDLPEVPLSLDFHPSANIIATGLVDGSLRVSRFDLESQ
jgi:hypothetical protein